MIKEPTKIAAAGDWHGDATHARAAIQYAHDEGADVVVQCGDFGLWPGRGVEYLEHVQEACERTNVDVLWLPGNHEDYDQIAEIEMAEADPFITMGRFTRIHYIPRGARWEWWGKRFMAIGGAVSVDRDGRIEGKSWWPQEVITNDDVDVANREPHGMDVIFSHDCPQGVIIPGIGPDSKNRPGEDYWPLDALADSQKSRVKLRRVWSVHQPKFWLHGHFHVPYEFWLGQTRFFGLDMNGSPMYEHMRFLTREELQ